jgi:hypothetical protein
MASACMEAEQPHNKRCRLWNRALRVTMTNYHHHEQGRALRKRAAQIWRVERSHHRAPQPGTQKISERRIEQNTDHPLKVHHHHGEGQDLELPKSGC